MIKLLDHGHVELVESWGSDERIIEAARMSTGKGFLGWDDRVECENCSFNRDDCDDDETCPHRRDMGVGGEQRHVWKQITGDARLLRYLWKNAHATPFEMAGLVLEIQAPIFVFREWHRHRTQSYNELSARYTPLPDVNYVPTVERLMMNAGGTNKQAGTVAGAGVLTPQRAEWFRSKLQEEYEAAELLYQSALQAGVPKELARVHLPVGRYSRMRASANLRNWLAFLTLRMAPNAQWEIRQYASAVGEIIAEAFPRTWALFLEDS